MADAEQLRGPAISEPGILNEREFDLLTTAPAMTLKRSDDVDRGPGTRSTTTEARLRSIARADPLIRPVVV